MITLLWGWLACQFTACWLSCCGSQCKAHKGWWHSAHKAWKLHHRGSTQAQSTNWFICLIKYTHTHAHVCGIQPILNQVSLLTRSRVCTKLFTAHSPVQPQQPDNRPSSLLNELLDSSGDKTVILLLCSGHRHQVNLKAGAQWHSPTVSLHCQHHHCYVKVLQQLQLLLQKWDFISCMKSSVCWHLAELHVRTQLRLLLVTASISVSRRVDKHKQLNWHFHIWVLFGQECFSSKWSIPSRLFCYESDRRDLQCFPTKAN